MEANILLFLEQRAQIVSALDEYGANVCEHGSRYYSEIATSLQSDLRDLATLALATGEAGPLKAAPCARERLSRIIACLSNLRETLILFRDSDPGEIMEVLFMISRHVGRIRLLGVVDPYADGMEQHIKELHGAYGSRNRSISRSRHRWARRNWKVLNFSDSRCDCLPCRGKRVVL